MKDAPSGHPYRDFEFAGWARVAAEYADTFERATRPCAAILRPLEQAASKFAVPAGLSLPVVAVLMVGTKPEDANGA